MKILQLILISSLGFMQSNNAMHARDKAQQTTQPRKTKCGNCWGCCPNDVGRRGDVESICALWCIGGLLIWCAARYGGPLPHSYTYHQTDRGVYRHQLDQLQKTAAQAAYALCKTHESNIAKQLIPTMIRSGSMAELHENDHGKCPPFVPLKTKHQSNKKHKKD